MPDRPKTELSEWANEIRLRAERRLGEMLIESGANGTRARAVDNLSKSFASTSKPTLEEIGISKDQSAAYQAIAEIPEAEFEEAIAGGKATTRALVRSPKTKKKHAAKGESEARSATTKAARRGRARGAGRTAGSTQRAEFAHSDNLQLQAVIDSLNKTDHTKEIIKLRGGFRALECRLQQAMATSHVAQRSAQYYSDVVTRIRRMLKVDSNKEMFTKIMALMETK